MRTHSLLTIPICVSLALPLGACAGAGPSETEAPKAESSAKGEGGDMGKGGASGAEEDL